MVESENAVIWSPSLSLGRLLGEALSTGGLLGEALSTGRLLGEALSTGRLLGEDLVTQFLQAQQSYKPASLQAQQDAKWHDEGLGRLSDAKIGEYVRRLYGLTSNKPSKPASPGLIDGRSGQAVGCED
jgi:hypothetical protein